MTGAALLPPRRTAGRAGRAARAAPRGFTFIELLVVIAILAVTFLLGIGMSELIVPEAGLNATAQRIADAFDDARGESIVRGRVTWLELDLGEAEDAVQYLRAIQEPDPDGEKDPDEDEFMRTLIDWTAIPSDVRIHSVVLGDTEPLDRGRVSIAIQPDGTTPSSMVRLWAPAMDPDQQKASGWATIRIAGLLGQARVLNRFVEPEFLREEGFQ